MKRETARVLIIVLTLVLIGVLAVYSASGVGTRAAERLKHPDPLHYVTRHLLFLGVGLCGMFLLARCDYHNLRRPFIFRGIAIIALVLLVLVLVPGIGIERGGARRWLPTPLGPFQPSEFAKVALLVLLAVKMAQNQNCIKSFWRGFVPPLIIAGAFLTLIYLEDDLGTPAIMGIMAMLMMAMAGVRKRYLIPAIALGAASVFFFIQTSDYRRARWTASFDPWADPQNTGYQPIQSLVAFAQGGLWGRGPGASLQKLQHLPEAHTDYVFAIWSEEMGLVGSLALIVIFIALLVFALRIAACARDVFGALLAGGIGALLALQAAYNTAMTIGLAPTKGLTLPFISSGGSALITYLILAGILLNVGLQAEEPERAAGKLALAPRCSASASSGPS